MPIFEYDCQDCGHRFETLVRSREVPECPRCHSVQLAKRLSVPAAVGVATAEPALAAGPGPCGSCGHPDGPGSCHWPQ